VRYLSCIGFEALVCLSVVKGVLEGEHYWKNEVTFTLEANILWRSLHSTGFFLSVISYRALITHTDWSCVVHPAGDAFHSLVRHVILGHGNEGFGIRSCELRLLGSVIYCVALADLTITYMCVWMDRVGSIVDVNVWEGGGLSQSQEQQRLRI